MRSASMIFAAAACTAAALAAACGSGGGTKTATPRGSTPGASVTVSASPSPAPSATAPAAAATPSAQAAPPTQAPAPTQPPAPRATNTSAAPPPPPPPPPSGVTLPISAQGVAFSTRSLSAPAGSAITIAFDNMDTGVLHNIQFFKPDGTSSIGATDIEMGPKQQTLSLGALAPGTYSYKCDVHPQTMNGTLTVS